MSGLWESRLGKAGEHFVCSSILLDGYDAFLAGEGLKYDIVVNLETRLIRVQVKTTKKLTEMYQRKNRNPAYQFNARICGKDHRREYTDSDLDVLAFTCVQDSKIAYFLVGECGQSMRFRSRDIKYDSKTAPGGRYIEDYPFSRIVSILSKT